MKTAILLVAVGLVAGCSQPLPVANNVTAVEVNGTEKVMPSEGEVMADAADTADPVPAAGGFAEADYLGRWTGVEGMTLEVAKGGTPGRYRLTMQWSLDDRGTFDGAPQPDPAAPGLAFRRNGEDLTLRRTDGDATGLKYLAGKRDCLTVKPGEGYCRD